MKKKVFSLFTSLIMVISLVGVMPTITAGAATSGDYEYTVLSDGTVSITRYSGSATTLSIPSTIAGKKVTSIGDYAFAYGSRLKSVTIGNSVKSIGEYSFAWNNNLTNVKIGNGLVNVTSCAFILCKNLKSVTIGNNVKNIEDNAFNMCYSLKSVIIPSSVKSIGYVAFADCRSLKDVYYTGTQTQWKKITIDFKNDPLKKATIHYNYNNVNVPTVTGFKVVATTAQAVKLTCNKVPSATGYVFYRANAGKWVKVGVSKTNVFTDSKLKSGTSYRYAVKAFKTFGGKNYYSAKYPTLWTSTNPSTVTGFNVKTTSEHEVTLACNKVSGATGYIFYRANAGKWVRVGVSKTNVFTDSKLKSGTSYRYAVKAFKTFGGKNYYSDKYPTLWTSTNPEVVNFNLTASENQVLVQWNEIYGATGYIVYTKATEADKWQKLATTTETSYIITDLETDSEPFFTIKAFRTVNGKTYNSAFTTKSVKVK